MFFHTFNSLPAVNSVTLNPNEQIEECRVDPRQWPFNCVEIPNLKVTLTSLASGTVGTVSAGIAF